MKGLIVDDETAARDVLEYMLEQYVPQVQIVGKAATIDEATNLIIKKRPAIVFLDIEMSGGNGFELLSRVKNYPFHTIFITAHKEYAIEAIKNGALDYLMKPLSIPDLISAVEKAEQQSMQYRPGNEDRMIPLSDIHGFDMIPADEIICCQANESYTIVFLNNGIQKIISKSLKEFSASLDPDVFFRVHHSYVIHRKYVKRFDYQDGGFLLTTTDKNIPVSRRKRKEFMNWLFAGRYHL